MHESTLWAVGTVAGMMVLGGAAGAAFLLTDALAGANGFAFLAALFFGVTFLASGMAMQLYRRGYDYSALVGGASGLVSMFAFFAVPTSAGLWTGGHFDKAGVAVALIAVPLIAGALSAGGTLFLARGVASYRARHGMVHAPK